MTSPLISYKKLIERNILIHDNLQENFIQSIDSLYKDLSKYQHEFNKIFNWGWLPIFGSKDRNIPKSLYTYGGVGIGKTMFMDMLAESVPKISLRMHFHELMRDVHLELNRSRKSSKGSLENPINKVVDKICNKKILVCIDEMEIRDIADAMIIDKVFKRMFETGLVVFTTSNRPPSDLYKDGLQRERFMPFINLIKKKMKVINLDIPRDYRRGRIVGEKIFFTPIHSNTTKSIDEIWRKLTDDAPYKSDYLIVNGRKIRIPIAAHKVARFTFNDLCNQPLGTNDYLQIALNYTTVILEGVPSMTVEQRDVARRFVILVDALYEKKCVLICSSECLVEKIYSGSDWQFEFQRTISRLVEMQSNDYLRQKHTIF
ncbi:MAG: cell division protein ZapE [Pseudomonadota bacterium]|nr:cell division protein ZapE [Pseudomonadota bacterium]